VKDNRGFSLLELLIVVAIILIIATIAIPSLLRSRQAANESAAVGSLKTISTAEVNYQTSTLNFYGDLNMLVSAGMLDSGMLTTRSGYNYSVTLAPSGLDYTVTASANGANNGRYDYYTTPDYVIRYSTDSTRAPASLAGMPVQP
jgi:prepilin-type N-terminal cleavage/methylation domain-containing protein